MRCLSIPAIILVSLVISFGYSHAATWESISLDLEGFLFHRYDFQLFPDPYEVMGVGFVTGLELSDELQFVENDFELTWVLSGLFCSYTEGNNGVLYYENLQFSTGGRLDIFADERVADSYTPPDYGILPPNSEIDSFQDGVLFLTSPVIWFRLNYDDDGPVTDAFWFEAKFTFGEQFASICSAPDNTEDYAFGLSRQDCPQGYDLELSGRIWFSVVSPAITTWGAVKSLFR